jgi:hypothetical protein
MRNLLAGAVLVLAGAANTFAADPQLLNLVMPDAQVLAGINVTNAEISPLGTFLLAQISANDQGLQQLIAATGFDPRKDVTEVLAASNGNPAAPAALALSKGNFDVAKIVAAIGQKSTQQVSTYNGATLIASGSGGGAVAFLSGGTIAVAGNIVSVKAALDRSSGVNSISPALATQAQTLSTTEDAWSVSLASLGALLPGMAGTAKPNTDAGASTSGGGGMAGQALQLVKNIQSCSAGLKFGDTVQFTAQATADTAEDAGALRDVIKMVAALAAMGAGNNKDVAAIAQFLQSLSVTTAGTTVNLSASVPESQIESLLQAALMPHATGTKAGKI